MLVFSENEKDKYEAIEWSGLSSESTVTKKSPTTSLTKITTEKRKRKLSKTNIQFLKSLGFTLNKQT